MSKGKTLYEVGRLKSSVERLSEAIRCDASSPTINDLVSEIRTRVVKVQSVAAMHDPANEIYDATGKLQSTEGK